MNLNTINIPTVNRNTQPNDHKYGALRYILILSSHLCAYLPKGLFPICLPTKMFKSRFNHPDYIK